jgi:D-serine deaminase-like pyridoxal phosphate-dependent protein
MSNKAIENNVDFRPHFKTHQSAQIGEWFKEKGIEKFTVSSVKMAEYFAQNGWKDILIAFPVNILEIEMINKLASEIKLSLLVDSSEAIEYLEAHLKNEVGVYIKIDTGYHRSGIWAGELIKVEKLAQKINNSQNLKFIGILTHSGHAYEAKDKAEIINIYNDTNNKLFFLKQHLQSIGLNPLISVGDTPSCSLVEDFKDADEIRPGNFVYYDLMQYYLGACSIDDIAIRLACPVVSKNIERKEIIIYGGAVHLSKEYIIDKNKRKHFGLICRMTNNGFGSPYKDCFLRSVSQEHGILTCSDELLNNIHIGDVLGIIPVHSCLTANLNKNIFTTTGKQINCLH